MKIQETIDAAGNLLVDKFALRTTKQQQDLVASPTAVFIWIHIPCLTGRHFFLRSGFAHVDNVIAKRCSKQSHGCSCQGCKATTHTGTLRNLPNLAAQPTKHAPELTGTLWNLPEPHQHTPELSGTFLRKPAPATTGAYLGWRPHWLALLGNKQWTNVFSYTYCKHLKHSYIINVLKFQ